MRIAVDVSDERIVFVVIVPRADRFRCDRTSYGVRQTMRTGWVFVYLTDSVILTTRRTHWHLFRRQRNPKYSVPIENRPFCCARSPLAAAATRLKPENIRTTVPYIHYDLYVLFGERVLSDENINIILQRAAGEKHRVAFSCNANGTAYA